MSCFLSSYVHFTSHFDVKARSSHLSSWKLIFFPPSPTLLSECLLMPCHVSNNRQAKSYSVLMTNAQSEMQYV